VKQDPHPGGKYYPADAFLNADSVRESRLGKYRAFFVMSLANEIDG
jgi:hypothetical protein